MVHTERDSAWVDVVDDLRWINGGKSFTWISERDGWRHLYVVSRDGTKSRLVTPGAFDLHNPYSAFGEPFVVGVDSAGRIDLLHGIAGEPDAALPLPHPARRQGQAGARHARRTSPGYHLYKISTRRTLGAPRLVALRHARRPST